MFSFLKKKNNYWGLSIKSAIGAENRYDYDRLLDANLSKGRAIRLLDHFGPPWVGGRLALLTLLFEIFFIHRYLSET